MTRLLVVCCFSLLLADVAADVTVTVMKGGPITLLIDHEEIKKAEKLLWTFNDKNIATIDLEVKTSQSKYNHDERFSGRLNLERNTGSLTINNFTTEDTGEYQLEIRSSGKSKYKTFSVNVSDQPSTLSVIKGDPVTLPTGVKIRPDDVQWKFKGNIIADLTHSTITNMDVNHQTGELKISDIGHDLSGEYEVKINARDFILPKRFSVNVSEEESVSRKEEGFVILHTNTEIQLDDVIEWKFKNTSIALFNKTANKYSYPDSKRKDRVQMDGLGSLTIQQLKTEDSGPYDVNINNSNRFIHKRFSLTVTDVSGADVTVIKRDSVTLSINHEEIKGAEKLFWKFNYTDIATIDLEVENSKAKYNNDERFRGRLNLERNTGSLTINNFTTEDNGEYQLEIKKKRAEKKYKTFSVNVSDQPNTLSVIKGDPVTLPTGVKIRPDDVQWKFKGNIIPDLTHSTITNMDVNHQTGELKISDIGHDQSGEYEVKINANGFIIHRIFRVDVRALTEVESLSVMEGETVTLNTKAKTQADDVIEWKFKTTLIAKVVRTVHPQPDPVLDERFGDRVDVNSRGSLIITHIKTNESGHYDVSITNSKHIIQKRFSLTVTESSSGSHQVKICPGLFVVVIMLVIALVMPVTGDD